MGNMNRQLLAAKSYYDEQNYEECLKILISARKNGSDDARKYFGLLLDTDDLFRETSDRFFYLYYSSPAEPEPDQKTGRLVKWQQRLLDLSFKNKFLNFRETKLSIPLLFHNAAVLEDQLAAGKRFQVNSAGDKSFACDYETIRNADENDPAVRYLTDEFSKKRLLSGLAETELSKRLLSLFRQGKFTKYVEMPEQGLPDATAAQERFRRFEATLAPDVRKTWRWRQLMIRAEMDAELARTGGKSSEKLEALLEELERMYRIDPARANRNIAPFTDAWLSLSI